jgi:hypothetical protein
MADLFNPSNLGSFVPTSFSWEIAQLQETDLDPKLKSLMIRLYQNLNVMSLVLNQKDTGYYVQQEFVNGQQFFPDPNLNLSSSATPIFRQVYRTVINFGALPNTATKSIPHTIDINSNFSLTRLYAAATDPSALKFIPIPYASPTAADNIEINMDTTNINIITGKDQTAYTTCYVVIEYIKQ